MAINSKVQLCNMALSHLGNYGTVSNIDTPKNDKEIIFSLWYDVARQTFLKMTMPNFCLSRKSVAQLAATPPSPFAYAYEYPKDCLKLLGIGNIEDKQNNYSVENNMILTDVLYSSGAPLRYVGDITDVTDMSPEFKIGLSWYLAAMVAYEVTQDAGRANQIQQMLPEKMSTLSGLNAQENKPIRISHSRFKQSRSTGFPKLEDKR